MKMKVERWEEESDEEWAERLAEEIALANNTETTQYMVHRDPYEEDGIIISYIGETGWTWKEHPEGTFKAAQILEWKNKAELLPIYEKQYSNMVEHALELEDKLKTIKEAFTIHYLTLHDCAWMDSKKMLKALDETAEAVKTLLNSEFTTIYEPTERKK